MNHKIDIMTIQQPKDKNLIVINKSRNLKTNDNAFKNTANQVLLIKNKIIER